VKPEINAVCTVMVAAVALAVTAVSLAAKWRGKRSLGGPAW
jgi:hypothetical protein